MTQWDLRCLRSTRMQVQSPECSALGIQQHCPICSVGHHCGSGQIPGPGTPYARQPKKKIIITIKKIVLEIEMWEKSVC